MRTMTNMKAIKVTGHELIALTKRELQVTEAALELAIEQGATEKELHDLRKKVEMRRKIYQIIGFSEGI